MNLLAILIKTGKESCAQLRAEISKVRLGKPGEILFDFRGKTYTTKEPHDVIVAFDAKGTDNEASRSWALKQLLDEKTKEILYENHR